MAVAKGEGGACYSYSSCGYYSRMWYSGAVGDAVFSRSSLEALCFKTASLGTVAILEANPNLDQRLLYS